MVITGIDQTKKGLVVAIALATSLLVTTGLRAQGNERDASLHGTVGTLTFQGFRLLRPTTPVTINLSSPLGSLVGSPFFVGADIVPPEGAHPLTLPNEPGVLALTSNVVPLMNSFSTGASLQSGGAGFGLTVPSSSPGSRLLFQAVVADATAPNGLAVTTAVGGQYADNPTVTPVFQPSPSVLAQFAYALHMDDLDGNGVIETLSGAREADKPTATDVGRVFVYSGNSPTPVVILDDPTPQAFSHFGVSISTGDINADGIKDIVVGARQFDAFSLTDVGKVVVFLGPAYTQTQTILPPLPEFRGQFGHWTSCGDFDGDGFCDLAISSIGATVSGFPTAGTVDIFFGPTLAPALQVPDPLPAFGDRFGYRMEASDVNRDGFDDLIVAATFKSLSPSGTDDSGAIFTLEGPFFSTWNYFPNPFPSQSGLLGADMAVADMDQDGWLDIVAGAELDNSGGLTDQGSVYILRGPNMVTATHLYSPVPQSGVGFGSGIAVGDVNNDDVPDLFVGEFYYSAAAFHGGRSWVIYGPDYVQGQTVLEPIAGAEHQFGRRVRAADLDGNGDDEMIVGVPFSSANGVARSGAIYFVDF